MCVLYEPFFPVQGETLSSEHLKAVGKLVEPWFLFALVWGVGATCDGNSRQKLDRFIRDKIQEEQVFPECKLYST